MLNHSLTFRLNLQLSVSLGGVGGSGGRIYRLSLRLFKRLYERERERDPF